MWRDSKDVADVILIVLVLWALLVMAFLVRRGFIRRGAASLECSLNTGAGWRIGLARYADDDLQWFRLFSLMPAPKLTASRRGIRIIGRRKPRRLEIVAVTAGAVILECDVVGRTAPHAPSRSR